MMIKELMLAFGMLSMAPIAFGQNASQQPTQTPTPATENKDEAIATDRVVPIQDTAPATDDEHVKVVTIDEEKFILSDGKAYHLDEASILSSTSANANNGIATMPKMGFDFDDDYDSLNHSDNMASVIAICFIVPCGTLLIGLFMVIVFFMSKTKAKNAIIEKAIDANYTLPNSFYNNQNVSANEEACLTEEDSECNGQHNGLRHTAFSLQPRAARDPKSFSSAVTLLAIGFALILYFIACDRWGMAFLAGGIPFFLGVGKLIGYFYIPGFKDDTKKKPAGGYRNYPTQGQRNHPGSYPPPYNGTNTNRPQ